VSKARSPLATWRDAVRNSALPPTAKLVALALSTWMNRYGDCRPAKETIARGCSLSVRAVDSTITALEAAGFLRVTRSKGRSTNRYKAATPHQVPGSTLQELQGSAPPTPQDVRGNPADDDIQPRISRHPTPQEVPPKAIESVGKPPTLTSGRAGASDQNPPNPVDPAEMRRYLDGLRDGSA